MGYEEETYSSYQLSGVGFDVGGGGDFPCLGGVGIVAVSINIDVVVGDAKFMLTLVLLLVVFVYQWY